MASKNKAVFGIFSSTADLDRTVESLKRAGFGSNDISILMPDEKSSKDFGHEKNTKAPEGATTGASTGVVLGGALGWLVGAGLLAIPGIGPFVAAGPIMAALAGAGIGGTVGGVSGALIGMGIPEFEAKRYQDRIQAGGMLLSVHCDTSDEIDRAEQLLKQYGAQDVSSTGEAKAPSAESRSPRTSPIPPTMTGRTGAGTDTSGYL